MMSRKFIRLICVTMIFAVCLVGISQVQRRMDTIRGEHELVVAGMTPNMTPGMVFAVTALSAFRGLIADILFLKLTRLQEDGKYYEINQLGRYIIQLQPDAPGVYIFLAWNMAYNVSVKFSSPTDRWRWVQRGIELLRDYGLEYNPRDPKIVHELGWIYYHKIGDILDDANIYYKGQLALQVIEILGPERRYDWDRLAAAPNNEDELKRWLGRRLLKELVSLSPKASDKELEDALVSLVQSYQKLGRLNSEWQARLEERGVYEDVIAIFDAYGDEANRPAMLEMLELRLVFMGAKSDFYRLLHKRSLTLPKLEEYFRTTSKEKRPYGGFPKGMKEELKKQGVEQVISDYFRTRWFLAKFKIDADILKETFAKYGYHDVRLPEAHSLYWAEVARQYTPNDPSLQRLIRNSMYRSTKAGRFLYLSPAGIAIVEPKFESIDLAIRVFEETKDPTTGTISGFVNFLKDTVALCYTFDEMKLAKKYFKYMKNSGLTNTTKYKDMSLDDFALGLIAGDIRDQSRKQVFALLQGMARQYIHCLAFGQPDRARRIHGKMERTWSRYHDRLKRQKQRGRLKLPPNREIIRAMYLKLLREAGSRDIYMHYRALMPDRPPAKKDSVHDPKKDMKIQRN